MIIIESKKKKPGNILKKYPEARIIDITSTAPNEWRKLSPFYPYGDIPVPNSGGMKASCVEAVWQGLKVFESCDIDVKTFQNDTMKNIKRTVRRFGRPMGHRYGVNGELLDYKTAREKIYIPTYRWMLENKALKIIEKLRELTKTYTIVLLDYNNCTDINNLKKPLSHANLVKAYVEGLPPYGDNVESTVASQNYGIPTDPHTSEPSEHQTGQLSLFNDQQLQVK